MKYSMALLALAAGAMAASNATIVETVTAFTTYCPEATTLTHGGKTYTVTEATTLTITDCPCTITKSISSTPSPTASTVYYTSCPESASATAPASLKSIAPSPSNTYSNPVTVSYSSGVAQGTNAPTASSVPFTGAASANKIGGLIGAVAGVMAFIL